jgi:hypothetical protein
MDLTGLSVGNSGVDLDGGLSVAGMNGHMVLSALDGVSGYAFYPDPKPILEYLEVNRQTVIERLGEVRGKQVFTEGNFANIVSLMKPMGCVMGYYIGGMKEEVREEGARTAQVLLGTYAMASEAMNIKTLNTMLMASPRKKIEQSTGRILRVQKDARTVQPLIVDIVDQHGVYQGQWAKRKAYYKKCAYKIITGKEVASQSKDVEAEGASMGLEDAEPRTGCLIVD